MTFKKRLFRFGLYIMLILALLLTVIAYGGAYFIKHELLHLFEKRFEPQTENVNVKLSLLKKFPNPYVKIENLSLISELEKGRHQVIQLKKSSFQIDIFKLLKGEYVLKKVTAQNAKIHIYIDEKGKQTRVTHYKKPSEKRSEFAIAFPSVVLDSISIHVENHFKKSDFNLYIKDAEIGGNFANGLLQLDGNLKGEIESIGKMDKPIFKDKPFEIELKYNYDIGLRKHVFDESRLLMEPSAFKIVGSIEQKHPEGQMMDLQLTGEEEVNALLGLLPKAYSQQFIQKNKNLDGHFHTTFKGIVGPKHKPLIEAEIKVEHAIVQATDYALQLDSLQFQAYFSNGVDRNAASSELRVNNFEAYIDGKPILADFELLNFDTHQIDLSFNIDVNLQDLEAVLPKDKVEKMGGQLKLKGHYKAHPDLGKSPLLSLDGGLKFKKDTLIFDKSTLPFRRIDGAISIKDSVLTFKNLKGNLSGIPFQLKGGIKNFYRLFFENGKDLRFDIDAYSRSINLDKVFKRMAPKSSAAKKTAKHPLEIPRHFSGNLAMRSPKVKYQGANSQEFNIQIAINNSKIAVKKLDMDVMHGHLSLNANLSKKKNGNFDVQSDINLANINTKRLLEMFKDFGQKLLTSKQVEGRLSGKIKMTAELGKKLDFPSSKITYAADFSLKDANLRDFEPLVKAFRYVKKKAAEDLYIDDLKGKAFYQKNQLLIPALNFNSNLSEFSFFGKRNADESMHFHLELSLVDLLLKSSKRKIEEMKSKKKSKKRKGGIEMRLELEGKPGDLGVKPIRKRVWEEEQKALNREFRIKKNKLN